MPRLLQRTRRPEAGAGHSTTDDAPLELPPYEPPSHPMDDKLKQKLASMYSSRETDSSRRQYEKHLSKSNALLFESVGSINEILFRRRQTLARKAAKRKDNEDKDESERTLEEYVAQLDAIITELTDSSEAALRSVIDYRAELEDQQVVLDKVVEGLDAQQPRPEPEAAKPRPKRAGKRRVAGSDGEDDEEGSDAEAAEEEDEAMEAEEERKPDVAPLVGVKELLEAARQAKMDEYEALSAYQRYAVNNDYIAFKNNWHSALHQDNGKVLPDASKWFGKDGRPRMTVEDAADEDDELVVEREILDLKCPLSLQRFKEPYSNHQCKHTFEKDAIMQFIRDNGGTAKCPVCSKDLRLKDLYLDEVILRKVRRAEEAARRGLDDTSDIEPEEDGDSSLVVGKSANVGKSSKVKNEKDRIRRGMEDIDEDED
ncbi:zinc-finger of the MIZ type in Nse subunit-domain-containing protein [Chaetomium strumarium]|uniref:Zinc-finger of the MIZ type in Nse subunit-domain-containing protein n=1 Tax=Chaetomium strumarium TaxID=1170767 RepID=A0AAJ0GP10_9PEZI|nr:zinc-finger of the MIZ type in Nse subunit-domain-containing protein [Chaetomium strumarium]